MQAVIKNNFPQMRGRLERMIVAVRSEYHAKMRAAVKATVRDLKRRTPKKSGRMRSGWESNIIGGSPKGRLAVAAWIWNKYAEKDRWRYSKRQATVRFSNLRTGRINTKKRIVRSDGRTVLRVLEYGARPHRIRAAHTLKDGRPGYLAFQTSTGAWVFTREVMHPGSRPHGMIRRARYDLSKRIKRINVQVAMTAQQVVSGRR